MSTDLRNDQVSRYVLGQMTEEEQDSFEEKLLTDAEIQQAVEAELVLSLTSKDALKATPETATSASTSHGKWKFAIAACLVAALVPSALLLTGRHSGTGPLLVTLPISSVRSGANEYSIEVEDSAMISLQISLPPSELYSEARIQIDLGPEQIVYVFQSESVDGQKEILVDPKKVIGSVFEVSGFLDNQQWLRANVTIEDGN